MLIATRFKRPTAPITFGPKGAQTIYFFTPVDPSDGNSVHACEITQQDHVERLLSLGPDYFPLTEHGLAEALATAAPISRAAAVAAVVDAQAVPAAPIQADDTAPTAAADSPAPSTAVRDLLDMSVRDLRKHVGSVDDRTLLLAAIKTEAAKDDPRSSIITILDARQKALA